MAKSVIAKQTGFIHGAPPKSGQEANLIQGVFVGVDSNGDTLPADYRASQGPVVARGVIAENIEHKDAKKNVLENAAMGSIAAEGTKIGGLSGLTKGKTYYLHTGGGITATKPATATNDIDQPVGWALTDTILVVAIQGEVIKA